MPGFEVERHELGRPGVLGVDHWIQSSRLRFPIRLKPASAGNGQTSSLARGGLRPTPRTTRNEESSARDGGEPLSELE
jgi:hypothetical protein